MPPLVDLLPLRPPGVSDEQIREAEEMLGHPLPADIVEFWRVSDGSGWVDSPAFSFQVLSLAEVRRLWALGPEDRAGAQRPVDLASDGSRERFCFDIRSGQIVLIDITWEQDEPDAPCGPTLADVVTR